MSTNDSTPKDAAERAAERIACNWIRCSDLYIQETSLIAAIIREELAKQPAAKDAAGQLDALEILLEAREWGAAYGVVAKDYPELVAMVASHDRHIRENAEKRHSNSLQSCCVGNGLGGHDVTCAYAPTAPPKPSPWRNSNDR